MNEFDDANNAICASKQFGPSNRLLAILLLRELREQDLKSQLRAIKALIRRNWDAEIQVMNEKYEIENEIRNVEVDDDELRQQLVDRVSDLDYLSLSQDATHSMSAVVMLASLFEFLFVSIFASLVSRKQGGSSDDDWLKSEQNLKITKNKIRKNGTVNGIIKFAIKTNLHRFLPEGYDTVLTALFCYRNYMLHNGLIWPLYEREDFFKRNSDGSWPKNWFFHESSDGEPLVFHMSDDFIEYCLEYVDRILDGVGKYLKEYRN